MIRAIREFLRAFSAAIDLRVAGIRTMTNLVEAVAVEEFNAELKAIVGNDQAAADVRTMALELAKMGAKPDDLYPAMREWYAHGSRGVYELASLRQLIDRRLKELTRSES